MIKENEYIRTPYYTIEKVLKREARQDEDGSRYVLIYTNKSIYEESFLIKNSTLHNFDIIEILKEGDYVNGIEIEQFDDEEGNLYLGFPIYTDALMDTVEEVRPLTSVRIVKVTTREKFEQIEFEV